QACTAPFGYVSSNTDCNDGNAAVKPSATETCNSADDDCDGQTDEGLTKPTFYRDQDQDGFGDAAVSTQACTAPGGYVTSKTDCDDASAAVKPGATETCNTVDDDCDSQTDEGLQSTFYRDQDQDGFGIPSTTISACTAPLGYVSASNDCNDDDGTIRPGALEVCDAVDNDCDGQVDEGLVKTFFRDQDGDGVGTAVSSVVACVAPPGYVSSNLDCNDADVAIKPGAVELCNGLDDDCDVVVDEGLVRPTFYRDEDQDGVGTSSDSKTACEAPPGYVVQSGDCSDTNPLVKPGAAEACNGGDDDCDGQIDEGLVKPTFYQDDDGDGYGAAAILTTACTAPPGFVADASDCDDAAGSVHPNASEICNLADDDCDGLVDDGLPTATYFRDGDGDGVGDDLDSIVACEQPVGYVSVSGDCDDDESLVSPSATERCNDRDDDCDDEVDEGLAMSTYFADVDLDGHGDADSTVVACAEPFAYVSVAGDCDDTRATIHPGAQEQCNEEDDDCDGAVDESVVSQTFYRDADADTWGRFDIALTDCRQPVGYVTRAGDCDDADADKNPTEPELCNDIDDDCDGITDEDLTLPVFYVDLDQDGYGDPASAVTACAAPMGTVSSGNDCDDGDAAIKPGAAELCNATDDDCDGGTDEGLAKFPFFRDADADGQGDIAQSISSCAVPDGYVSVLGDCDDQDPNVHGAAVEVCDGVDQDCDGAPDDGLTTSEWHPDVDLDGYGTGAVTVVSCAAPFGHVADAGDCDDGANGVNPAATETCNDVDDDCNGTADDGVEKPTWYADDDQDGYGAAASFVVACVVPPGFTASAGDCDDLETGVNPAAAETCNEVDDDCDGAIDQGLPTLVYYRDDDDDSWGRSDQTSTSCRAPAGFVVRGLDCDDQRDTVHPEAMETCNGRDDDCDEVTDDGVTVLLYTDADGDGYGDASSPVQVCAAGTGLASVAGDCNDAVDTIHPDATEAPNGIDDDCDGIADDGTELGDDDGDGYSEVENDCDDGDELVFPGQTELENGVDDDCDTVVDDGTPAYDDDGDGFSEKAGDCDDDNTSVFEGAVELEDELDNDCDGEVDEDLAAVDADEDGYDATVDCDDESEFISPAAIEVENALDDDCDGEVDEGTPAGDDDDDGVSENDGDCDDSDAAIVPGAAELANGIDDDCDGTIDDNTDVYDDDGDGYSEVEGDCNDASIGQGPDAEELQNGIDDDCDSETDEGSADGVDGTDTTDSTDAGDATDGLDGTDTTDASDGADATDAEDGADATDGADSVDGDAGDDATGADDGTDSADDVGAADAVDSSDGVDDAAAAGVEAESSSGCALGEGRRSTGVGFTLLLLVAALGWAVRRRA
ncbi:MAG: hypothetical protein IV100_24495, partial [Myxococcales bacterium]|nr:hypothetical protein [Myxococcales bacterium]